MSVNGRRPHGKERDVMTIKPLVPVAVMGVLLTASVAAAAVIAGTPGDDVLRGSTQADHISAFAGNDLVYGRGGGDDVRAGTGNDVVRGADGNDLVYGGHGNDVVAGGDGNDRLHGGSESDQVSGGNGNDRAAGNKGDDVVSGNDGNDDLFGGWGADRVHGGSGNDDLHALAPDGEPDLLSCGPGNDKAWVLRAERPTTQLVGCEKVYVVDVLTADQDEGENADTDAAADS
jgi:Ca2+-binding RTX toxin-like protein